jgi:5-methylcytosine-specific restriction endonuclease McrA
MTQHRRPPIPFSDAPRGTCRWCGETILHDQGQKSGEVNRRRRWHPACVDEYNASDPREARRIVRRRDRGICRECRADTNAIRRGVRGRGRAAKLRAQGFKPRRSLWELDHIVPLIDGGGHELDNLQTLCVPCHERKTAAEARSRARHRREQAVAEPPAPRYERADGRRSNPRSSSAPELDELLAGADATNRRVEEALARLED